MLFRGFILPKIRAASEEIKKPGAIVNNNTRPRRKIQDGAKRRSTKHRKRNRGRIAVAEKQKRKASAIGSGSSNGTSATRQSGMPS